MTRARDLADLASSGVIEGTEVADDAITYAKIQNVSADERILGRVSGANGVVEELTKAQMLTMMNVADGSNAYVHPNHSGEVTSTNDGATVIADDIVDEANLKISNAGSNDQFLQKQSGNTGGLTWASASGTTINNNADNRVISGSGTANTLEGEANLTFDGTDLTAATGNVVFGTTAKGIMFDGTDGQITHNASTNAMTICSGGFTDQLTIFPRDPAGGGSYSVATWGDPSVSNNYMKYNFKDFTHGQTIMRLDGAATGGSNYSKGLSILYSGAAPDGTPAAEYIACSDTGAMRFQVNSDGDCKNHDNSYGAISDERIKQDIKDANSQWDDIKGLRVRNFKKKDDVRQYGEDAWEQIGLIAQETELVSPKLIRETTPTEADLLSDPSFGEMIDDTDNPNADGTFPQKIRVDQNVKSMKYSVLYMKAIKCLQEAQTRIETLEAKVTALENV